MNVRNILVAAALLATAVCPVGCEYYGTDDLATIDGSDQATVPQDKDMEVISQQIKDLKKELSAANDEEIKALEAKIAELEKKLAEDSVGGGSGTSGTTTGGTTTGGTTTGGTTTGGTTTGGTTTGGTTTGGTTTGGTTTGGTTTGGGGLKADGESCAEDFVCQSNVCNSLFKCGKVADGGACGENADCVGNYCSGGGVCNSGPRVVWTIPNASEGCTEGTIKIKFSEPLDDPSAVTASSLMMTPSSFVMNIENENPAFTFTLNKTLNLNADYTVTIKKGGIKDGAGNEMAEDYTWNFHSKISLGPCPDSPINQILLNNKLMVPFLKP